jgi:hypothetical protein
VLNTRARPSTIGHSASVAAICRSATDRCKTCPPLNEKPHSTIRAGSTSGRPRAKRDCRSPVGELRGLAKALARLAAGIAEIAVVEDEHRGARARQELGVRSEAVVARE